MRRGIGVLELTSVVESDVYDSDERSEMLGHSLT